MTPNDPAAIALLDHEVNVHVVVTRLWVAGSWREITLKFYVHSWPNGELELEFIEALE